MSVTFGSSFVIRIIFFSIISTYIIIAKSLIIHAYLNVNTVQSGSERIIGSFERSRDVAKRAAAVISKKKKLSNFKNVVNTNLRTKRNITKPTKPLTPPFPDGLNGGRIVTLSSFECYSLNKGEHKNLLLPRDIEVWLPPDYDMYPEMKFPVLYVHDGQNAIRDSSSWTGSSWRLAGALTRLSERKLLTRTTETNAPPIVVLMPSCSDNVLFMSRRHLEYGDVLQNFAQAHADFVACTLKPLVDTKFRTVSGKKGTAAIGSSLGGQASLFLCLRHPDVFGSAACMSPAFQAGILGSMVSVPQSVFRDKRIYMDNGGDENDVKVPLIDLFDHITTDHWWNPGYWWLDSQLQVGIDAMKFAMETRGIKFKYKKIAGGRHNERAWASRIHEPLLFLYGDSAGDLK